MRDCESTRLVASEVSNLWKVSTPEGQSLSLDITIEELMSALQHLKSGKTTGPDSICPELIAHAGSEMNSSLCEFLSFCMYNLKTSKIWRRVLDITILKPNKPQGIQRAIDPSLCCVSPLRSSSIFFMPVLSLPLTHISLGESCFWHGRLTIDQVTPFTQDIEESFLVKKGRCCVC